MSVGLVLDLDGTLIDSEPLSTAAWNVVMRERGLPPLESRHLRKFNGVSALETARQILHPATEATVRAATEQKRTVLLEMMQTLAPGAIDTIWFPGVRELLSRLDRDPAVRMALCTSSKAEICVALVDKEPQHVGARVFRVRVTQDDVPATELKPHPAPYLLAAERLGLAPPACIAIEDSPTGAGPGQIPKCMMPVALAMKLRLAWGSAGVAAAVSAGYGEIVGVLPGCAPGEDRDCASRELIDAGATRTFSQTSEALEWVAELIMARSALPASQ